MVRLLIVVILCCRFYDAVIPESSIIVFHEVPLILRVGGSLNP
jgi:hypothetical protein